VLKRDFDNVIRFWNLSKPTIAAVKGPALAGGCELAMPCDITLAGESATFGEPEVRFGAGIVVMLLPWIVGAKKAKEIAFLGKDSLSAQEAFEIGMVNQVVPDDQVLETALAMARAIAVVDPMVIRRTKQQINETMEIAGMSRALRRSLEIDLELEAEGSPDKRAFLDVVRSGGLKMSVGFEVGIAATSYLMSTNRPADRWTTASCLEEGHWESRSKHIRACVSASCYPHEAPQFFELPTIPKAEQMQAMPQELLQMTWYCRRPKITRHGYSNCNECNTYLTVKEIINEHDEFKSAM